MSMKKISREKIKSFIKKHATEKKTLDVGSRRGQYMEWYPNKISVDLFAENDPDVVGDAHNLPFGDEEFAVVLCTEMLEHVHDPQKVVNEFYRVLKPEGKLILTTRFLYPIHEAPNDYWRFTRFNLERLFSKWNNVEVIDELDPVTTMASLVQRFSWQTKFRFNPFWQVILRILVWTICRFKWIVKKQYGDVRKSVEIDSAFTSGYHVVAYK